MFKAIANFAVLATLAAAAVAPAHAWVSMNGGGTNGITRNGADENGGATDTSVFTTQALEAPPETR